MNVIEIIGGPNDGDYAAYSGSEYRETVPVPRVGLSLDPNQLPRFERTRERVYDLRRSGLGRLVYVLRRQ
jgi:hypothetical protein